jgi:ubiquinone/menaquinone biosynthesis C-methylase UbiE
MNSSTDFAQIYQEVRPQYPIDLYDFIRNKYSDRIVGAALEIGPGPGTATLQIVDYLPFELTLIEPDDNFRKLAKRNLEHISNLKYESNDFENNHFEDNCFDAIFSATSFHWLNKKNKYNECYRLLKEKGLLVLYWNNYLILDSNVKNELDKMYQIQSSYIEMINGTEKSILSKIDSRSQEIVDSGYFRITSHELFERIISYSPERFLQLINTFADQPLKNKELFKKVSNYISGIATIDIRVISNLEIAEKK